MSDSLNIQEGFRKNSATLIAHLTDIVAASESGFASQPLESSSNWIIGHILLLRTFMLENILKVSSSELAYSTLSMYLLEDRGDDNRKPYSYLLKHLKESQEALSKHLQSLNTTDLEKDLSDTIETAFLDAIKDTSNYTSIGEIITLLLQKETELTTNFVTEQRTSKSTGIY